jgi:hypothetical protein
VTVLHSIQENKRTRSGLGGRHLNVGHFVLFIPNVQYKLYPVFECDVVSSVI